MSKNTTFSKTYKPTHDEAARQGFVGSLKGYLNGRLEVDLDERYESHLKPQFIAANGHAPATRDEGTEAFSHDHTYQLWGAAVFTSQNLMWETVDDTCQRLLPDLAARHRALQDSDAFGRLELDSDIELPEPIRNIEIHRQPGGYFNDDEENGLLTGLRYFGTVELYRAAKGLAATDQTGAPGMGQFILAALKRRFPEHVPTSILDLGCGTGTETVAYAQSFPDAQVWGVDLSEPLLRFAHTWAGDGGHSINFRQADARHTGFADESFDLIVSNILFHETWFDILPDIMREALRLLRPGGVFLNVDIPYQPHRLSIPKQVTNHWQVVNNGEPFWSGFADMDMREQLVAAGFENEHVFADYDAIGSGEFHVFGGRKA